MEKKLTPRENFLEMMRGGNPERFVNQYEYLGLVPNPIMFSPGPPMKPGDPDGQDEWGVWLHWGEGQPGKFPLHDAAHLVVKDITQWKEVVKMPPTKLPKEAWEPFIAMAESVDRSQQFCAAAVLPGIFERTHHLMKIDEALANFYEEPDDMHDIIEYITEYEMQIAEEVCSHLKPDALFHHDDWGSQLSTFMSADMFEEFLLEPYKRVFGYYKDHGVEIIVHHSDSYAVTLVPYMIEMGMDVWQGCMLSNNIPALIDQYGGQIAFMGGLENGRIDRKDWTPESVMAEVQDVCEACGTRYFIPCLCSGEPAATFDGVYAEVTKCIDIESERLF